MLSRSLFVSLVLLSSVLLPSCNKDEDTRNIPGPAGTNGQDGRDGKDGVNGIAAVVYDSFDSTQSCAQSGQLIFVNSDRSFFVCKDSRWDRLLVNGKDGEAGADGKDGVITVETRLGDSCGENGQLLFDMSTRSYYSCQNKAWTQVALNGAKGEKGDDGVAVVVLGDFDSAQACRRSGQLVYQMDKKTFFLCQGTSWMNIDLKGPKGDAGAPGANGQTLFVETAAQLPVCKESNLGVLYILKQSGDVKACSNGGSGFHWITVYQAPSSLAQGDQSMVDDCIQAKDEIWDFYKFLLHRASVLKADSTRETACQALAPKAANMESLFLDSFVERFSSSGDIICGTNTSSCYVSAHLNDTNAYILRYFVNLKVLRVETSLLTNLNNLPSIITLKSLSLDSISSRILALGDFKNMPSLTSLTLNMGYLAATNGESGLTNLSHLSKTLNLLDLTAMSLTKRDLVEVAKLPNLIQLNVRSNPLGDFSPLAGMQSLARLTYTGSNSLCPFPDTVRCQ